MVVIDIYDVIRRFGGETCLDCRFYKRSTFNGAFYYSICNREQPFVIYDWSVNCYYYDKL